MTQHEQLHKSARMGRHLRHEPLAFVESIAHEDRPALERILGQGSVQGTVLRLFFGASEELPTRSLTGLISAAHAALLLPIEQLQVICVSSVGETINGTPRGAARTQFERFAKLGAHILNERLPDVMPKLVFAEDTFSPQIDLFRPLVEKHLAVTPGLQRQLAQMGNSRHADFARYAAAHVVNQDTTLLELNPLQRGVRIVTPERILAIGGQKERVFHAARVGVRAQIDTEMLVPSVQIFTHHTLPPYFMAKNGEQTLDDAIASRSIDFNPADSQARRDMCHFEPFLTLGEHHA